MAHGLSAEQGLLAAAATAHGLHGEFAAAQGLHGLHGEFATAHGLQAAFSAWHRAGLAPWAAQGLQEALGAA